MIREQIAQSFQHIGRVNKEATRGFWLIIQQYLHFLVQLEE